ncbi:hypothetical protein MANES_18G128104v8 [Manihot esculenta]|uniref:Uncharacterized protein n=1 Tax=Manihot esculenta TaxID=3983 RepID=A0ACB7G2S1_MANES|nr:hypothetical protein MANES_18G128104v8 [Manihot esculenta]
MTLLLGRFSHQLQPEETKLSRIWKTCQALNFQDFILRGGFGRGQGHSGGNETITGRACPKGLYGIFCEKNSIILEVEGMASSSL